MRLSLITVAFSLSGLLLAFPATQFAQQAPIVWIDATGTVHSSPPEPLPSNAPAQTAPANSPSYTVQTATPPTISTESAPTAIPANHYAQWQDPAEGAFSVSLPEGWKIAGGTVRTTRTETQFVVNAQSPNGGVHLFLDDPRVLARQAAPGSSVYMSPVMPASSGANLPLVPYRPGNQFATLYVQQVLCPAATNLRGGPLTSQTEALTRLLAGANEGTVHADAGEVSFRCGRNIGYVYAITVEAGEPGGAAPRWADYRLAGYLASATRAASAAEAINEALGTFRVSPSWLQSFTQENGDTAGKMIRVSDAISQSILDREQAMNAALQVSLSDAHRELASLSGPVAGSRTAGNPGNGHDYNAQLQTKVVCDELDRCQTVSAIVENWYSDCSGRFYPGPASGGPPPASLSPCWSKGR
jgi:hypothetical protein